MENRYEHPWFLKMLAKKNQLPSRRDFLSKLTRLLFGVVGVTMASKVELFGGPLINDVASINKKDITAGKTGTGQYCGLHGYVCGTGNCTTGVVGAGPTRAWNACCDTDTDPQSCNWQCCTYIDQCSSTPHNPSGCNSQGTNVAGTAWCGVNGGTYYVCTVVSCSGSFSSSADCICNSHANC